jgi:hypothetical protein
MPTLKERVGTRASREVGKGLKDHKLMRTMVAGYVVGLMLGAYDNTKTATLKPGHRAGVHIVRAIRSLPEHNRGKFRKALGSW